MRECPGCAELVADEGLLGLELGRAGSGGAELDIGALLQRVEGEIARERGTIAWLRSRPTPLRVMLGVAGAALVALGVVLLRHRVDLAVYPLGRLVAAVGAYALLAGVAVRSALRPLQQHALPRLFHRTVIAAAVLVPFAVAASPAAHFVHPASLAGAGDDLLPRAVQCFLFGGAVALPALGLLFALDRGAHHAWSTALASAAAAGLIGILALELHCPITHPIHLVAGHATVGAALLPAYSLVTWVRHRSAA